MNFSEQPPSKQWAALKFRGELRAEVWFKPEGEPFALTFRIPRESFLTPGMGQRLTAGNLLKSVGVAAAEVESWHHDGDPPSELGHALPPPSSDATHLNLHVRLKPPPQPVAPDASGEPDIPEARWQDLEARWNAVLGLEASIDTLRMSMETVRAEMDGLSRKSLTADEKVNALQADVAQWNKVKSRVLFAVPKAKEFIHRSTWATGTPERKKLEEVFKNHIEPQVPCPGIDQVSEQLDGLIKDRQVLSAHGTSVHQECKGIIAELHATMRTLQGNAAARAANKRAATNARGKFG